MTLNVFLKKNIISCFYDYFYFKKIEKVRDKELINNIKKGNSDSYRELFVTYYSPLCEYASKFVSDIDAEELVQDLMLYIWEEREQLTIEKSVKSYLFLSVRNRSFNFIRDNKFKKNVDLDLHEHELVDFPEFYTADDLEHKIQALVEELPEKYKETFELSRLRELTNKQIADSLDVSVKTIEYRITNSLKILRNKIKYYLQ